MEKGTEPRSHSALDGTACFGGYELNRMDGRAGGGRGGRCAGGGGFSGSELDEGLQTTDDPSMAADEDVVKMATTNRQRIAR